jgi:hypothetical protein
MPKDATKNIDRYKVRGGTLNEFNFTQNQEQVAEKRGTKGTTTKGTKTSKGTKSTRAAKATTSTKRAGSKSKKK